jgi:large subunit ribosomal protein L3
VQDPGKVWKGRKMAGRMGGKFRTTQNLLVHRIDLALNLIYVRGHVPGVDDQYIEVSDAVRKVRWKAEASFMAGKDSDEWLDEGVTGLPMPGLTLEDVKSGEWPEIVEWPGTGKPLMS